MFKWFAIWLVVITTIVFVLQLIYPQITDEFALVSVDVLSRPWTLVTSMFLHGGVEHILFNMFALGLFGSVLERVIGSKRFLVLYFVSGVVSGMGSTFFYEAAIGASGAIFGVLGALGILRPRLTVYIGYVPMPMALAVVVWAVGNLGGLFVPGEIAYAAHLAGLVFGLLYGYYLKKDFGEHSETKRKIQRLDENMARDWENSYLR